MGEGLYSLTKRIAETVAFIQEYKTEQSLKALENLSPFYARAQRSGRHISLQATDLVPGDMIYFEAGDRIPADARILEANGLSLDESSLTGENQKVYKTPDAIEAHPSLDLDSFGPSWYMSPEQLLNLVHVPRIPLAERKNIAYMGTLVSSGNGRAVVIATGPHSELGKICGLMKDVNACQLFACYYTNFDVQQIENPRTPLQESMDQLGQQLAYISIAIIILISLAGVLQGRRIFDMFTIGVSLAVAAIPEGLPIVVTVTLALGVLRMAKQNAIVKRLPSVETLSSVSVLCIDKTGALV